LPQHRAQEGGLQRWMASRMTLNVIRCVSFTHQLRSVGHQAFHNAARMQAQHGQTPATETRPASLITCAWPRRAQDMTSARHHENMQHPFRIRPTNRQPYQGASRSHTQITTTTILRRRCTALSGSIDPAINTPDSHAKLGGTNVPPGGVMIRAGAIAGAFAGVRDCGREGR
jgi:hypothetical protein